MTDASPVATSRSARRAGVVIDVVVAAVLVLIATRAESTTGQALFVGGAVLTLLLLVGRWTALHGLASAVVAVLLLQPALAQVLTPPIRHLIPNRSYVIETDVPGIRNGSVVTIDERGFRPTTEMRPSDPSRRIVLIGGSTFEQIYLDDRATTGWLLADALGAAAGAGGADAPSDAVEVINTGLAGLRSADHLVHLGYFERDADAFDETHHIIMMGINDWNLHVTRDVLGEPAGWAEEPAAPWRRVDAYPLVRVGTDLRARLLPEPPALEATHSQMSRYDERPKVEVTDAQLDEMLWKYRDSIRGLIDACETGTRTRCTFVTQPTVYRPENFTSAAFRRTLWVAPPFTEEVMTPASLVRVARAFNDVLLEEVAGSGCSSCGAIDADAALGGRPELFYDDCHFTEAGSAVLAETLIAAGVVDRP